MKQEFQIVPVPEFVVVQHKRDRQILEAFKSYFQCGYIKTKTNDDDRLYYVVRNFEHIMNKIIPFFDKHKLKTQKNIDFEKFRSIVLCMSKNEHLTDQGFSQLQIKILAMRK
jgi:hypothetical protein